MKLTEKMKITVLAKEAKLNETSGRTSYGLTVMQNSEAGSITCTKEVFEAIKPLHSYDFLATYDDKYSYMKLTDVDPKTEAGMTAGK